MGKASRDWLSMRYAGHFFFLVLFVLSVLYCRERLFADGAYYLVQLINDHSFAIEHGRFIAVATQVWPWLAVKLGLPLKAVVLAYSAGDILYYYLIFLLVLHVLRDEAGALLLVLLLTLGVMYNFYCPVTELLQGFGLLVLFGALLESRWRVSLAGKLLLLLLAVTIVYSHPLAFLVFFFFLLFKRISGQSEMDFFFILLLTVGACATLFKMYNLDAYDGRKVLYHTDPSHRIYRQLFSLTYMKEFVPFFLKEYWIPVLTAVLVFAAYLRRKATGMAFFAAGSALGYVALMVATHYAPYLSGYSERMYLPLFPIVLIPLVYDLLETLSPRLRRTTVLLLFILVLYRLYIIYDFGKTGSERIRVLQALTEQSSGGARKLVLSEAKEPCYSIEAGWSLPAETLLLSSLEGKGGTRVLYVESELKRFKGREENNPYIYRRDSIVNDTTVNTRYFSPLTGPYQYLFPECQ
jgi:hypothetical protein